MTNFRPPRDARPPRPLLARLQDPARRVCHLNSFSWKELSAIAVANARRIWFHQVRSSVPARFYFLCWNLFSRLGPSLRFRLASKARIRAFIALGVKLACVAVGCSEARAVALF
jgi:hypothetical protein